MISLLAFDVGAGPFDITSEIRQFVAGSCLLWLLAGGIGVWLARRFCYALARINQPLM
jgi:hypothetical protein